MGRFTLPLCYNYLQFMGEQSSSLTAFVGKLNLLPVLGTFYIKLFPIVFAVILLGKLMNFHRKLLSTLGMIAEQTSSGSKWKAYELEGQKIIYKEKLLVCVQIIRIVDLCS